MGKTISTHNGSAAHRGHNVRDPWAVDKQPHIDRALSGRNEILHDEKPREAYQRIFGDALRRYNEKQDRPERRIRDYYSHIERDAKKHAVYEMIVQIGDRNDTGLDAPVERACLKEFYAGWKERNPNLECIGAYIHADEKDGTVHMHLDYVPVAHGYKKGMETQTGLVKALSEQGFHKTGKLTAQIQWQHRENQALERICLARGIEIEHPQVGKGVKHQETELFKISQELEKAQASVQRAEREAAEIIAAARSEAAQIVSEAQGKVDGLEHSLIAVSAEYEAKKAYVEACDKASRISMAMPDYAKEKKTITGKVTVTVPKEKWVEKHVSANEKEYLSKAELAFEKRMKQFKRTTSAQNISGLSRRVRELDSELANVKYENRVLKGKVDRMLDKIDKTLDKIPAQAAAAFIKAWDEGEQQVKERGWDMER